MQKIIVLIAFFSITNILISADREAIATRSANIVAEAFNGKKNIHLTPYLIQIARHGHHLSDAIKHELKSLGFDFSGAIVTRKLIAHTEYFDTDHFRIHYSLTGFHAVDNTDSNGDSVPDYIEDVATVFEYVYDHLINVLGFTPPPSDGLVGGSSAFDIYINNLGSNIYGFTNFGSLVGDNDNSTEIEINAYLSNIEINSSFDNLPTSGLEGIQVTAGHEFFHAIQLGYDGDEQLWLLESTATWMEEETYDDINDCYQYLIPRFNEPHLRLNTPNTAISLRDYGSFIFFKYIDEHLGGADVIRKVWEYSRNFDSKDGDNSIKIIDLALNDHNQSFKKALNNMAIANCILSADMAAGEYRYEEATGYKNYLNYNSHTPVPIRLAIQDSVNFTKGDFSQLESHNLQNFAAQYFNIETLDPIKVVLEKPNGETDPITDLKMHIIKKTLSGNFEIYSGYSVNVDPGANTDWIGVVIVADENEGDDFNFILEISDGVKDANKDFIILNQFPNPTSGTSTIKLKVNNAQKIVLKIYDVLGKEVKTLYSDWLSTGLHSFTWHGLTNSGEKVGSGFYYGVASGSDLQVRSKIILIR